jgi:hypothetical protein
LHSNKTTQEMSYIACVFTDLQGNKIVKKFFPEYFPENSKQSLFHREFVLRKFVLLLPSSSP